MVFLSLRRQFIIEEKIKLSSRFWLFKIPLKFKQHLSWIGGCQFAILISWFQVRAWYQHLSLLYRKGIHYFYINLVLNLYWLENLSARIWWRILLSKRNIFTTTSFQNITLWYKLIMEPIKVENHLSWVIKVCPPGRVRVPRWY